MVSGRLSDVQYSEPPRVRQLLPADGALVVDGADVGTDVAGAAVGADVAGAAVGATESVTLWHSSEPDQQQVCTVLLPVQVMFILLGRVSDEHHVSPPGSVKQLLPDDAQVGEGVGEVVAVGAGVDVGEGEEVGDGVEAGG